MKVKIFKDNNQTQRQLVDILNKATDAYDAGFPIMSDEEWDELYFQLLKQEENGAIYADSPTQTIIYNIQSKLKKAEHNHAMLSLAKTKDLEQLKTFIKENEKLTTNLIIMPKLDGLTCSLLYENGKLIKAETRGDGYIGEDITHNIKVNKTVPQQINYKERLVVDGEIICTYKNFENFEYTYRNPRNFAAGSIRLLDPKECEKRNLEFIVWEVIEGFDYCQTLSKKFEKVKGLGFKVITYEKLEIDELEEQIDTVKSESQFLSIPIDGAVIKFDNITASNLAGHTSHHFKNALAYKFYDETYETVLRDIDWTMGRTGVITPVAIVDPIDIDGTLVERASLHNLKIMSDLHITHFGQKLEIFKANMIIPQVAAADTTITNDMKKIEIPNICPICGEPTEIVEELNSKFLRCTNPDCGGKLINKLDHYCGKKGLDIKGLSKATLSKLADWGWIKDIEDIYNLDEHEDEWIKKPGFGTKSVKNILLAIKESMVCELDSFISALGIKHIGSNVAKEIYKYVDTYEEFRELVDNKFDFTLWEGFGPEKAKSILNFDYTQADKIYYEHGLFLTMTPKKYSTRKTDLNNLTFCITGKLKNYKNRQELQNELENLGAKVVSSISSKTSYLINNDIESQSAKNKKAKSLSIPIITEDDLIAQFLTK